MTPATVSGSTQALPLFSDATLRTPVQNDTVKSTLGDPVTSPAIVAPIAGDTITISSQSKQAVAEVKKEEMVRDAAQEKTSKKEEADVRKNGEQALSKVQFVYDQKGELSVRYMDASDRLIYQTPSEIMLHLKEMALKSEASVDMKA